MRRRDRRSAIDFDSGEEAWGVTLPVSDGLPPFTVATPVRVGERVFVAYGGSTRTSTRTRSRTYHRGRSTAWSRSTWKCGHSTPTSSRSRRAGDAVHRGRQQGRHPAPAGSYLLNLHVRDVIGDGTATTGRIYVDPNGEKLDAYRTRAPILTYDEAHALYGNLG